MTQTSTPHPVRSQLLSRLTRRAIQMVEAVERAEAPTTYVEISLAANALMAVTRIVERLCPEDMDNAVEIVPMPLPEGDEDEHPVPAPLNRQQRRRAEAKARNRGP